MLSEKMPHEKWKYGIAYYFQKLHFQEKLFQSASGVLREAELWPQYTSTWLSISNRHLKTFVNHFSEMASNRGQSSGES